MKKKVILLSIILFPSLLYFFFELTKANFKKMAYFGPKTVNEKGDTVYFRIPKIAFSKCSLKVKSETDSLTKEQIETRTYKCDSLQIDTTEFPVYCILFLDTKLRKEGFKLNGLIDYLKYKQKEFKDVPVFFIAEEGDAYKKIGIEKLNGKTEIQLAYNGDFDSIPIKAQSFIAGLLPVANRDSFLNATYFKQKPFYVMDYFAVLVDKQRHIRGYYDPTFNAEIKRMIADYKHLKIRDGYAQTQKQNDIKQNEN